MAEDADGRLRVLEDELTVVRNQVQQTLLDIREHILDLTNPFRTDPDGDGVDSEAGGAGDG